MATGEGLPNKVVVQLRGKIMDLVSSFSYLVSCSGKDASPQGNVNPTVIKLST